MKFQTKQYQVNMTQPKASKFGASILFYGGNYYGCKIKRNRGQF